MVICDDCLNILKKIEDNTIDMVYLDPPFFSQKIQCMKDSNGIEYRFSDIWETRGEYIEYIRFRFDELKILLRITCE